MSPRRVALFIASAWLSACPLPASECADGGTDCADGGAAHGSTGDVGQACSPGGSGCTNVCLELQSGAGVCIDTCGPQGRVDCPSGYVCNTRPLDSGDTVDICLPNGSCGSLTYQGYCDGATLHYCGNEGPLVVDCAQVTGQNGQAMQCAVVNPSIGSNCVSSEFSSGCGAETENGRCDGNAVVFCQSLASGNVVRQDCTGGQQCVVSPDGHAGCVTSGATGCGSVTYQGYCEGATLVYCLNDNVTRLDCTNGRECAFVSNEIGYDCVQPITAGTGSKRARGSFSFEKRPLTLSGLGSVQQHPVRQAIVRVLRSSDNQILSSGYTGTDGRFDLLFEETGEVYVAVFAAADNDQFAVAVRDCPLDDCGGAGNVYAIRSAGFTPSADTDVGGLLVGEANGAGAFNVFDVFVTGQAYATQNYGQRPPALTAQWSRGSNTRCNTSCFSGRSNTIYVLSTSEDTDEYDDPVLLHEFGHYMESAFSHSDSPGGAHDGSPTDPRLAWGEGYGTWVGCSIAGSPLYVDSRPGGASVTDVSDTGIHASGGGGMLQLMSEYTVSEALWHLSVSHNGTQGTGTQPVFDVLGHYFTGGSFQDRGVGGVDFVDFLDGWYCRAHGNDAYVRSVVSYVSFPYDYNGPTSCP
ncbi:MAG: hypothetical protein HY904_24365 [Deltaproteobacteria bacterium]|nr:hypothetical protein [Deltaproteobacteria bacterium]